MDALEAKILELRAQDNNKTSIHAKESVIEEENAHTATIPQPVPKDDTQQILAIMLGACMCLKGLHDNNIIHQDVKPGNIFIRTRGDTL